MELRNSKTTYLGKSKDGRDRFAIDASVGAIQMRENGGEWQDIDPTFKDGKLVRVPYGLEVTADKIIFTNRITGKAYSIDRNLVGFKTISVTCEDNQLKFKNGKGETELAIVPYNTGIKFTGRLKENIRQVLKQMM